MTEKIIKDVWTLLLSLTTNTKHKVSFFAVNCESYKFMYFNSHLSYIPLHSDEELTVVERLFVERN